MRTLKTYKKFINESINNADRDEFHFSSDMVEEYFKENNKWSGMGESVINFFRWSEIINVVDEESLNSEYRSDFANRDDYESWDSYYEDYIKEDMNRFNESINEYFESEILDYLDAEDDAEEIEEKNEYTAEEKLEELKDNDESTLGSIITDYDVSEFMSFVWDKQYGDNAIEYLNEIYGDPSDYEPSYGSYDAGKREHYEDIANTYYESIKSYIDEKDFDKLWYEQSDYEYKEEFFFEQVDFDDKLKEKLIEYDKDNILPLYNELDDLSELINTTERQEKLIELYKKDTDIDEMNESEKKSVMSDFFIEWREKEIDITEEIKKKYSPYMMKIVSRDFNL